MSRVVRILALSMMVGAVVGAARPSIADVEISPFAGYYIASDLYNSTGSKVELTNDVLYGGRITFSSRQGGLEFAYTRTGSDAKLNTVAVGVPPGTEKIGRVDFDSYDINFLGYQYAASPRVIPYGLIGFGWSVTHPTVDSNALRPGMSEPKGNTLFNFAFGLGAKVEMSPKLGLRLEGKWRITDTAVTTSSGIWCDPWGYCYSYASDWYDSGEFSGGLTYKFGGGY